MQKIEIPDFVSDKDLDPSEPVDSGKTLLGLTLGVGALGVVAAFGAKVSEYVNSEISQRTGFENAESNPVEVV